MCIAIEKPHSQVEIFAIIWKSPTKVVYLHHHEDDAAITVIGEDTQTANDIYNLKGERIKQPQSGLNIVNRQKVYISPF